MNIPVWNEWTLTELIGEGAFSKVYRAEKHTDGAFDTAAIKVISIPSDERQLRALTCDGLSEKETEDFLYSIVKGYTTEIKLMTSFRSCPNVVSILDHTICRKKGSVGWDIFIRMELLTPLDRYISSTKPDEAMIIRLGSDICSALSAFSSASPKIVHRDIKPTNIFVSDFGTFKLGDLGSAREILSSCESYTRLVSGEFTPPESANSNEYNELSDIYALGLVMYKLANRNLLPFVTSASDAQSRREAYEERFSGREIPLPCGVSTELGKIICKACAFCPEDRFRSAGEFSRALSSLHDGRKSASRAPVGVLISTAVIAAAAVGTIILGSTRHSEPPLVESTPAVSAEADSGAAENSASAGEFTPENSAMTVESTAPTGSAEEAPNTSAAQRENEPPEAPEDATVVTSGTEVTPGQTEAAIIATVPAETTASTTASRKIPGTPASTSRAAPVTSAATTTSAAPRTSADTATTTTTTAPAGSSEPEVAVEYTPESAFQYSNSSAGVVITKYVGNYLDVVIPPYLGGLPVVEIGSDSFSDATVRSVKLPEGVAKISDRAFFFCQAMDSINLPESLQIIGGNAFYGCLSLTRLYIPANVISIDCLTFGWTSLREINVASGNRYYTSQDGVLYNGSMTTLIFYPPNRPGQEFTLPDTVTEIGFYAIDRPVNLKKLILNSSLREFSVGRITGSIADISAKNNPYFCDIDGVLFSADGSKLIAYPSGRNGTSYTVPDGTSSIGTYAFADAGWLQVLDLPDSLASFSQDCIALCSSLNTVKYRGTAYTGEDFIRRFAQ